MTLEDAKKEIEENLANEEQNNSATRNFGVVLGLRIARDILAKVEPEPDDTAEDEGVEIIGEQVKVGDYVARWESTHEGPWLWSVHGEGLQRIGMGKDRAEARKAALEAARGLG